MDFKIHVLEVGMSSLRNTPYQSPVNFYHSCQVKMLELTLWITTMVPSLLEIKPATCLFGDPHDSVNR